jgi:phenylpyruvate tautomerase PptA (4-oxalocrotonate tautomerase family)
MSSDSSAERAQKLLRRIVALQLKVAEKQSKLVRLGGADVDDAMLREYDELVPASFPTTTTTTTSALGATATSSDDDEFDDVLDGGAGGGDGTLSKEKLRRLARRQAVCAAHVKQLLLVHVRRRAAAAGGDGDESLQYLVATRAYTAPDDERLTFSVGDVVVVVQDAGPVGWQVGALLNDFASNGSFSNVKLFPVSYFAPCSEADAVAAVAALTAPKSYLRAKRAYTAAADDELSFAKNDVVLVIEEGEPDGWWLGGLLREFDADTGEFGAVKLFPSGFFAPCSERDAVAWLNPDSSNSTSSERQFMIAKRSFKAKEDDELSFRKHDVVAVIEEGEPDGWWLGGLLRDLDTDTGEFGTVKLFPVSFFAPCSEKHAWASLELQQAAAAAAEMPKVYMIAKRAYTAKSDRERAFEKSDVLLVLEENANEGWCLGGLLRDFNAAKGEFRIVAQFPLKYFQLCSEAEALEALAASAKQKQKQKRKAAAAAAAAAASEDDDDDESDTSSDEEDDEAREDEEVVFLVAKRGYKARDDTELTFAKHDVIMVAAQDGPEGFWYGSLLREVNALGEQCDVKFFPLAHCAQCSESEAMKSLVTTKSHDVDASSSSFDDSTSTTSTNAKFKPLMRRIVRYSFEAEENDEMTIHVGDVIEVLVIGEPDGWWRGRIKLGDGAVPRKKGPGIVVDEDGMVYRVGNFPVPYTDDFAPPPLPKSVPPPNRIPSSGSVTSSGSGRDTGAAKDAGAAKGAANTSSKKSGASTASAAVSSTSSSNSSSSRGKGEATSERKKVKKRVSSKKEK